MCLKSNIITHVKKMYIMFEAWTIVLMCIRTFRTTATSLYYYLNKVIIYTYYILR